MQKLVHRLNGGRRLLVVGYLFTYSPDLFDLNSRMLTRYLEKALIVAVVTIFIRSCFRVAELNGGFGGRLANNEVTYMILEGAMVAVAALAMTVVHPGFVFGRYWKLKLAKVVFSSPQVEMENGSDTKASHP